jgi:histidinol-phosphate/aromatic aminotransferase/cobyric acid decarboxylase-like protein/choline kinase
VKAIILAAGYARRMRPLSTHRHKTLLEIGGRSIIARIVDGLVDNDVTDICVVTGYRADEVKSYLDQRYASVHFTFVHNENFATTNNIYSMALALEEFTPDDDILLIESDLIFEPAVLGRILRSAHPNVALVDRHRIGMDGTVVTVAGSGVITQVIPSSLQDERFDFSDKYKTLNIYKFSADFCRTTFRRLLSYYARAIDDNCYYELILGILIYMQQIEVHAEVIDGEAWAEVDDPNDLRAAEFLFCPSDRRAQLDSSWGGYWNTPVLDFAFIRNMYFPTPAMISELRANLPQLIVNYGSTQSVVGLKLAYYLLCEASNLRVLNGASEFFPILRRWFTPGDVLLPSPSFGEYLRAFPSAPTYSDRVGISMDEVDGRTRAGGLVVFVNPNSPTGTMLPTSELIAFAIRHPATTVLVDESFIEFSGEPSILPAIEREHLGNVIVLKSLSKSLGVPGIRLGYLYSSSQETLGRVSEDLPVWNVNSVAENYLEILLKHRAELEESLQRTVKDREHFAADVARVPFIDHVYPSSANFVLASLSVNPVASSQLVDELLRQSIYVKDVSNKFDDGRAYWRLAVRLASENERLCEVLSSSRMRERLGGVVRPSRRAASDVGSQVAAQGEVLPRRAEAG